MPLHSKQKLIVESPARFKVIRAGRRSGKTTVETEIILFKAVSAIKAAREFPNRKVLFIAPTQKQARTIIWEALKSRVAKIGEANESRLEMRVPTVEGGFSTIYVGGWENRENYRGMSEVYHMTFDETDTMQNFFIGYQEIFRPMLIDTGGSADFIGTPKKENPNLRRLEKELQGEDFEAFHFTTYDNPIIPKHEIDKARADMDGQTFKQEILAEYVENEGALFRYTALVDMFTNTIPKRDKKYLIADIADDGSDKTVFGFWHDLDLYRIEQFSHLNTEGVIAQTREYTASDRIPMSQTAVDAIGVGAGVASSSLLGGIVPFKSSYAPIRTDPSIVALPGVHYTTDAPLTSEYKNLRSQCVFTLARLVNNHQIAVSIPDVRIREAIIEELSTYQNASKGDGKLMATEKDEVKELIGRSPDLSDVLIMRMYFVIRDGLSPFDSEEHAALVSRQLDQFERNSARQSLNSTR